MAPITIPASPAKGTSGFWTQMQSLKKTIGFPVPRPLWSGRGIMQAPTCTHCCWKQRPSRRRGTKPACFDTQRPIWPRWWKTGAGTKPTPASFDTQRPIGTRRWKTAAGHFWPAGLLTLGPLPPGPRVAHRHFLRAFRPVIPRFRQTPSDSEAPRKNYMAL